MSRVLITGGSGFVGSNLVDVFAARYEVAFTYLTPRWFAPGPALALPLDVRDLDAVRAAFQDFGPDIVIHAAGNKDVPDCERLPGEAMATNALGTRNVARACREVGVFCVVLSTDLVFACQRGPYAEHDIPRPSTSYGRSKLGGERLAREEHPYVAICRSGGVYGQRSPLLRWVADELRAGRTVDGFTDIVNTPTYARDLGEALDVVIRGRRPGLFHLAGPDRVSRYELFRTFARTFSLPVEGIVPATASDSHPGLLLQPDASLSCLTTVAGLGARCLGVEEGMERLRAEGGP